VLGLPALEVGTFYPTMLFPKSVYVWKIALLLVIQQSSLRNFEFLGYLFEENPFLFVLHYNLNPVRDLRTAVIVNGFRKGDFLDLACEKPETLLFTH
jgi:hypothetical protein